MRPDPVLLAILISYPLVVGLGVYIGVIGLWWWHEGAS